jgi:hypothetical protein
MENTKNEKQCVIHDVSGITGKKWKQCCAEEIQRIWKYGGGSMNIVRYENHCPKCNHYIGLTQTNKKDAIEFLQEYGLEYSVDGCEYKPK